MMLSLTVCERERLNTIGLVKINHSIGHANYVHGLFIHCIFKLSANCGAPMVMMMMMMAAQQTEIDPFSHICSIERNEKIVLQNIKSTRLIMQKAISLLAEFIFSCARVCHRIADIDQCAAANAAGMTHRDDAIPAPNISNGQFACTRCSSNACEY